MNFDEQKVRALFTLAGIEVLRVWKLPNRYWPDDDRYAELRRNSPWFLVKTPHGMIEIGWRKRVMNIDWSDTPVRDVVTEDEVTKDKTMVHAWTELKAAEYLQTLAIRLDRLSATDVQKLEETRT